MFYKISSAEKILVPESLFNKVTDLRITTLLKKRLRSGCFPVNFSERPFYRYFWTITILEIFQKVLHKTTKILFGGYLPTLFTRTVNYQE